MGFRGLDFSSGLSKYGDLIAQGQKDRLELEDRDARVKKELEQQQLNDAIKVQSAGQSSGLFADRPDLFQKYGGSMVPQTDLSSLGVQQSPGSPQAMNAPQAAPDRQPAVVPNGGQPNDQLNQYYQSALGAIAQQAPGTVQNGFVHPYAAKMAQELAVKKYEADQRLQVAKLVNSGKNDRAGDSSLKKIAAQHLSSLDRQEQDINKNFLLSDDEKAQKVQALRAEREDVLSDLGHVDSGRQAAAKQQSATKPDGKYYSAKANKTYTYQGGKVVKVEDGHS